MPAGFTQYRHLLTQHVPKNGRRYVLHKINKGSIQIVTTSNLAKHADTPTGFLKDPEAIVQPFVKLYKFYVEPFILPFLAYYTHFWAYVARGLTMVLHILYSLFKRLV